MKTDVAFDGKSVVFRQIIVSVSKQFAFLCKRPGREICERPGRARDPGQLFAIKMICRQDCGEQLVQPVRLIIDERRARELIERSTIFRRW